MFNLRNYWTEFSEIWCWESTPTDFDSYRCSI